MLALLVKLSQICLSVDGRVSVFSIATRTSWTVRVSSPGGGEVFHTLPDRHWGRVHPPSYNMGTEASFGGKVARTKY